MGEYVLFALETGEREYGSGEWNSICRGGRRSYKVEQRRLGRRDDLRMQIQAC